MKIGGVEVKGPAEEILILPRLDGDIVIRARAVTEFEDFQEQFKEPKPPVLMTPKGAIPDLKDEGYLQQKANHEQLQHAFLMLKSLEPSEIEWETVNMDDPKTWPNWKEELLAAGLSAVELARIQNTVAAANCLDEGKLEKAREVFLRGLEEQAKLSSGQSTEQPST